MKMIVANCTQQVQDFVYRLPETNSMRTQRIEIGGQIQISGSLSKLDIDAIVEQHARYGMVAIDEIDRTKPFIGVCYSIDKPIPVERIRVAMVHNEVVLTERGKVIREEAALSVNAQLEQSPGGQNLQAIELSVVEETKDGNTPTIAEGIRVTRHENPGPTPSGGRQKGSKGQRRFG